MTKKLLIPISFALFILFGIYGKAISQTYFLESFEGDTTGTFKNVAGNTGTVQKWAKITTHYAFGNSAVRFDTSNTGDSQNGLLEQKVGVNISTSTFPILSFYHMCLIESRTEIWDYAHVEISSDGGQSWNVLPPDAYLGDGTYFPPETPTPRTNYTPIGHFFHIQSYTDWMSQILTVGTVPPQPGGALWKKESFSLEGYKTNNVKVRFQINTDEAVLWWGWAIDEIKIAEPEFANDIKPYSIDSPVKNSVLLQGNSFIPSGSICNIGNSTQTNISVTYKIYNTLFDNNDSVYVPNTVVYSQSTSVASLPAGQVANVEYLSTSLNSPGFYYAVLLTSVPGDQNTSNDSLSSPFNIGAIISGTYYVGGTNPTPDFATFADAMNYLNTSVVGGNTTFILNKTLFSEQGSRMQATYLYPDSGHTVILKPGPGMNVTMNFLGTPEKNYGISVQNSNNIIIDGSNDGTDSKNLTVQVNDLGGVITTALQVINCTNSDFKNITLKGYRNNSIGIGSVLTLTSSGNAVNKNILLNNLRIYKGNYGIFAQGNSSSKRDTNIVISNCVVGGQGDIDALLNTGIYMNNIDMADVHHNEVNGVKRNEGFGSADVYGIHANTRFSRFYNNNIHNIWYARNNIGDTASGFLVMGMRVNGRTAGFDSKNHVFNNFIYDLRSDFAVFNSQKIFGLRVSRGKSDTVSHNTVLLTGRNVNQDTTAAFVLDSTSVYNVNNIFYNGRQDSTIGYSFAIWKRATTANSSFLLSNNNVLYAPSPSGYAGGKGNGLSMLAYRTLTNWQTNQSPNVDTNSVYGDPVLIKTDSLANLHVADSTKSWAESR